MVKGIVDHIESKRIEKNTELFKYLAISMGILAVFKIISHPEILLGNGQLMDYIISLSPLLLFLHYHSVTSKHKGQFIRWTEDKIEYKSKELNDIIAVSEIQNIEIHLELIRIYLADNIVHIINIEDYTEFEDRKRIKNNFKRLLVCEKTDLN